jgi:hypothetical protein
MQTTTSSLPIRVVTTILRIIVRVVTLVLFMNFMKTGNAMRGR